jgi:hypothetical protein
MNYADFVTMRKYKYDRILDECDRFIIQGLESTCGWMNIGLKDKKEQSNNHRDAELEAEAIVSLTNEGRKAYRNEYIKRIPSMIKTWFYDFIHS